MGVKARSPLYALKKSSKQRQTYVTSKILSSTVCGRSHPQGLNLTYYWFLDHIGFPSSFPVVILQYLRLSIHCMMRMTSKPHCHTWIQQLVPPSPLWEIAACAGCKMILVPLVPSMLSSMGSTLNWNRRCKTRNQSDLPLMSDYQKEHMLKMDPPKKGHTSEIFHDCMLRDGPTYGEVTASRRFQGPPQPLQPSKFERNHAVHHSSKGNEHIPRHLVVHMNPYDQCGRWTIQDGRKSHEGIQKSWSGEEIPWTSRMFLIFLNEPSHQKDRCLKGKIQSELVGGLNPSEKY